MFVAVAIIGKYVGFVVSNAVQAVTNFTDICLLNVSVFMAQYTQEGSSLQVGLQTV